jgi:hypothetical protein
MVAAALIANTGVFSTRVLFSLSVSQSIACAVLILAVWFDFWLNTLRLLRRMVDASRRRVLSAAVGIPVAWVMCAAVVFGIMPWVIGFIWLMIDSARR